MCRDPNIRRTVNGDHLGRIPFVVDLFLAGELLSHLELMGASRAELQDKNSMNSARMEVKHVFDFVVSKAACVDYYKKKKSLM